MKTANKYLFLLAFVYTQSFCIEWNGKFGFDIALDYQSYLYKEPSVMHIKGGMQGIIGSISYTQNTFRHILKTGFYFSSGNLTYHGAKCEILNPNSCQSYSAKAKDRIMFVDYIAGLRLDTSMPVWFNIGLGYRILNDKVSDSSAYRRKQDYLYAIIGLSGEYHFTDKTMLYINAYYRRLILGNNTSYITQVGYYSNLHFKQSRGYGALFELGARHQFSYFALSLEAYADYWNISDSDVAAAIYRHNPNNTLDYFIEPKNYTLALGGRIKFSF